MDIRIVDLDLDDPQHLDAAVTIRDEILREANPDLPGATEASVRAQLVATDAYRRWNLLAWGDGEPVGLLRILVRGVAGASETAIVHVEVRSAWRRRGVAAALIEAGLDICARKGLSTILGTGHDSEANRGFWGEHVGLRLGLVERESRLALADVDATLMSTWIEQRTERAPGYTLTHIRGTSPPHLRSALATLETAMNDAPTDDLDLAAESWTEADVVAEEELRAERGEERWVNLVLDPEGEPAGVSIVLVREADPANAIQDNTVVMRAHRQRGIGRWMKADMWQRLRADRPDVEAVLVENAVSNDPMLSINTAMGFVEVNRYADWQGTVADARSRLSPA